LAALGGAFGSSAISVDAYGKASLYGQQKLEFLHIADKHVNREKRRVVPKICVDGSKIAELSYFFRAASNSSRSSQ
jgi:hypothetical protein